MPPRRSIPGRLEYSLFLLLAVSPVLRRGPGGNDWWIVRMGAQLLDPRAHVLVATSHGHQVWAPGLGLHLYARFPIVQVGPLALGFIRAWLGLGAAGPWLCFAVTAALSVPTVALLERAADVADRTLALTGGLLVVVAWWQFGIWAHPDDALVLVAGAFGVWAVSRRRPLLLGLAVGAGLAAKPTAAMLLPLVLALPGRRARTRALLAAGGLAAAVWGPFLLADHATLAAIGYQIPVSAQAPLRWAYGALVPHWVRPAQLLIGWGCAAIVLRRGRWYTVVMVAAAARFLLEPGRSGYYAATVVVAAVICDLFRSRPLPVLGLATYAVLLLPGELGLQDPVALRVLRVAGTVLPILAALALPQRHWLRPGRPPITGDGAGPVGSRPWARLPLIRLAGLPAPCAPVATPGRPLRRRRGP